MIHFDPVREPGAFNERARIPGTLWMATHPGARRPVDLWSPFKPELAEGFFQLCAYSAMYEPVGTVDHFISVSEDPSKAYEWSNYRYAASWINSSKASVPHGRLLDPFEVEDGWFEILLPSLQLVVNASAVPEQLIERAQFALLRLHLRDDERVLRQRRQWYELYLSGDLTLSGLSKKAPLIARAVDARRSSTGPPMLADPGCRGA